MLTEKRKKESQGVSGERRFFKRSEIEEARLKKLREEEEAEKAAKVGQCKENRKTLVLRSAPGSISVPTE